MNPEAVEASGIHMCPRCGGEMVEDPEMSAMLIALRVYHCQRCGLEEWMLRR